MDYLQSDYGFVGELGYFFIPRAMQNDSKFKASQDDSITLVKFKVENGCIILKHHSTISINEHKKQQKSNPKEIRTIDELGRVFLLRDHMEILRISPSDIMKSHLVNNRTIVINRVVVMELYEL
jgi:hypothetical protein